ncbi:MAG TPA: STAS domain-containing protein [Burkholderiales bacterium]|nr:STAS domain-containing protein [Burkholderiales bacterium]
MSARIDGERLVIAGNVDALTVPALFEPSMAGVRAGISSVDFAEVVNADSSAIALALAMLREAEASGRKLNFQNIPPTMLKLARLYDVGDLLGASAA